MPKTLQDKPKAKPAAKAAVKSPAKPAKSAAKKAAAAPTVIAQTPAKPKKKAKTQAPAEPTLALTHDAIALRAYEIWVAQGRPAGHEAFHWHQAEAELMQKLAA